MICVKLLGDYNFRAPVLHQAIERLQFSEASAVGFVVISVVLCFLSLVPCLFRYVLLYLVFAWCFVRYFFICCYILVFAFFDLC